MKRRKFLNTFGKFTVVTPPILNSNLLLGGSTKTHSSQEKYFLIYDKSSEMERNTARLLVIAAFQSSKNHESMKNSLVELDSTVQKSELESLARKYGPATQEILFPVLIYVPHPDAEDVEVWDERWLNWSSKALEDACYPISGGWWSVEGDWNPSKQKVRRHLFESMNHTSGHFTAEYLDLLSFEELQSLHSDHHREMTDRGMVHWKYVNSECPA